MADENREQDIRPDGDHSDRFGVSIAIDGEYLIAGADSHDSAGISNQGAAYVSYVRHVSEAKASGSCTCGANDNLYMGSCGALSTETSKFCGTSSFCCAASSDECCETNGGAVAGIVIAIAVVLAASITGCAYCCKCCCFKKTAVMVVATAQPVMGVQMVPYPQGVQMAPHPQGVQMVAAAATPATVVTPK